jgi:hypothetical protein
MSNGGCASRGHILDAGHAVQDNYRLVPFHLALLICYLTFGPAFVLDETVGFGVAHGYI